MIWLMIAAGAVALTCFVGALEEDDCPRMILGYDCRGKHCDHSLLALEEAKEAMGNNYWWE